MRVYAIIILFISCSAIKASDIEYMLYKNDSLGVSFEYPSWAKVEDISQKGKTNIWFHIGKWPKILQQKSEGNTKSPISGVSFSIKKEGKIEDFLKNEREGQIKGGYKSETIERNHSIGNNIIGTEFVRNAKHINKKMHYFVFPSLKKNVVLSLWHLQDTSTGFMGYPEEEKEAVIEYKRMIKTLKVYR
ncbi:MAG: hypothetical protein ABW168_17180 [Sedimenticola sp.]